MRAMAASTTAVVMETVAVEVVLMAAPPHVVLAATVAPSPSAKSTAKSVTPPSNVGTRWMIHTKKKGRRRPWHLQTRTMDDNTSDLDRLAMREQYHSGDTVQVGNGTCLQILHTGSCSINTDTHPLSLNNVLYVPNISKHLLSVHKLSRDNNIFFKFHPWYYFIKDRATRKLLLEGKCESDLYPLKLSDVESLRQALVGYSARPDQ
jgi:hypothetical protein